MNKIYFIIGASGAGKTTIIRDLEKSNPNDFEYCFFDRVGVPSDEEMVQKFGSGENWQKETTKYWVKKIKEEYLNLRSVILDGQIRPSFIEEACKENNISAYEIILFDCSDETRKERLIGRGHLRLANEQMMNWAKSLREDSKLKGYKIIDNSNITKEYTKKILINFLQ